MGNSEVRLSSPVTSAVSLVKIGCENASLFMCALRSGLGPWSVALVFTPHYRTAIPGGANGTAGQLAGHCAAAQAATG